MIKAVRIAYCDFLQRVFRHLEKLGTQRFTSQDVSAWLDRVAQEGIPVESIFKQGDLNCAPPEVVWQNALTQVSGFESFVKYRNLIRPELFMQFDLEIALAYLILPLYLEGNSVYYAVACPPRLGDWHGLNNYLVNVGRQLNPRRETARSEDIEIRFIITRGDELKRCIDNQARVQSLRQGEIDISLFDSPISRLPSLASISETPSNISLLAAELESTFVDADSGANASVPLGSLDERNNLAARLCDGIIAKAYTLGASDFHVKPEHDPVRNRFAGRILFQTPGGIVADACISHDAHLHVVTRFKVMAKLDIANHRAQDGQVALNTTQGICIIRVSTSPVLGGEWLCGRVLPQRIKSLDELGLPVSNLESLKGFLGMSQGMILFSGPTGSGKSTSLAASMTYIRDYRPIKTLLVTVEDPIEQWLTGANVIQRELNPKQDKSMAGIIRELMRKNPGVIMVGEIRDRDTADTAFRAVLTGHLLLSTVHANGSAAAFTRLLDLGVERYQVAYSILSVHQRLVPLACRLCQKVMNPGDDGYDENRQIFVEFARNFDCQIPRDPSFLMAPGCKNCGGSGYTGYVPLFEFLPVDRNVKELILKGAGATDILAHACHNLGVKTIPQQAVELVSGLVTTPQAIYHACALA